MTAIIAELTRETFYSLVRTEVGSQVALLPASIRTAFECASERLDLQMYPIVALQV